MSRPWSSLPSQNVEPLSDFDPGGSRPSVTSSCARSYGFCGEISGARIATTMMTMRSARPNTATGLDKKSDATRLTGVSSPAIELSLRFSESNPRIERRVENVHDQVDQHEHEHDHQEVRDDDRTVEQIDRIDQQLAHPGPGEDGLGDDRERDHRSEFEPDDGHDRDQNVAQHVHSHDPCIG